MYFRLNTWLHSSQSHFSSGLHCLGNWRLCPPSYTDQTLRLYTLFNTFWRILSVLTKRYLKLLFLQFWYFPPILWVFWPWYHWHYGPDVCFFQWDNLLYCSMSSSLLGLYPLDVSIVSPVLNNNNNKSLQMLLRLLIDPILYPVKNHRPSLRQDDL